MLLTRFPLLPGGRQGVLARRRAQTTSMPAFPPSPERFLLFLSARQEHHPNFFPVKRGPVLAVEAKPLSGAEHPPPLWAMPSSRKRRLDRSISEALLGLWGKMLFSHPHPSSRLREFLLSPVLSSNTPPGEARPMHAMREGLCAEKPYSIA